MQIPKSLDAYQEIQILSLMPEQVKNKLNKFRKSDDRLRSLFGEILVRTEVSRMFGIKCQDVAVSQNPYGKPYLQGMDDFHFNISHSGVWVLCIFGSAPVGVDIEKIESIDAILIAERFFSSMEREYLSDVDSEQCLNAFYEIWTMKESYVKAIGKGLSIPLDAFDVIGRKLSYSVNASSMAVMEYELKQYNFEKGYECSACAQNVELPKAILIKDAKKLVKEFNEYSQFK